MNKGERKFLSKEGISALLIMISIEKKEDVGAAPYHMERFSAFPILTFV